jgi:DNA-binding CsgD family transcriptional regulator
MPIGRPVAAIVLSPAEKEKLTLIASRPKSNQRDALRARIVLGAWEGLTNTEIARRERVSLPTVGKWRSRYASEKIEALADAPAQWSSAEYRRQESRRSAHQDPGGHASGSHPLEQSPYG